MDKVVVCALYQFTASPIPSADLQPLHLQLLALMKKNRVRGTLLLASEGINGTICGSRAGIDTVLKWLKPLGRDSFSINESLADEAPFKRTKVKIKKEIVTMGVSAVNPLQSGEHVDPKEWNALLEDDDMLVVDTRNEYEVKIGSFENSIQPHTTNFREFPDFADEHLQPYKHKKIAMYCTGGIRCEKSTAYLKQKGFEHVFQLKGGILNYLASVDETETRWRGECFVFDDRVSVDHQLKQGSYDQCHACRLPISDEDKQSEYYVSGVSCPYCHEKVSAEDKQRYQEREKQVKLAMQRGTVHIGPEAMTNQASVRRNAK